MSMAALEQLKRSAVRVVTTMAATILVLGGTAVSLPTAAAEGFGDGCTEYMVYLVPGTSETTTNANPSKPAGMLAKVGQELEREFGEKVTVVYVPYSASAYNKGLSYKGSKSEGVRKTAGLMAKCPRSKVGLAGYSQGAEVAGDVAWHIGHGEGPVPAATVRAVALLADPKRGNEKLVGTKVDGAGVAGERKGGYGSLEGRIKWVCDEQDMYCNTSSANPFVGIIGKAVTGATTDEVTPLSGETPAGENGLDSLVSDFGDTDLTAIGDKASELKNRTAALTREGADTPSKDQLNKIGELAASLNKTYSSTADIKNFADKNGARTLLTAEKKGTPGAQTADVLDTLDGVDLGSLISNTASIAETTAGLAGGDMSSLSTGGEALKNLATMGLTVASESEAVSSTDRSNLAAATGVLGSLKVSTVIDTSLMALTTVLSTDYQGIFDKVVLLGSQLAAMDANAAHTSARELNVLLEPWVDLAASANTDIMPMAADMVAMIPDPYGVSAIASQVMRVLAQVDIKRLADNVGLAQEVAWSVVKGNPAEAIKLVPIGLDIGSVGVQSVLGGLLGRPVEKTGTSAVSGDLLNMTSKLAQSVGGAQNMEDLGQLATDAVDFSSFIASNVHTSAYTSKDLVGNLNSVEYMAKYLIVQLGGGQAETTETTEATDPGER
ncbi:cutinase family protein [Gordonia sp. GAMMA]|uniref:cutinase family protein n=1 Tax=Gordonia sp. GAMMA TaxID=2502241 RepID=UPI001485162D|nr:cutinase family protein [Gordonia sp. GAMMA]